MKRMSNIFGLQIPPASQMLGDCSLGCFLYFISALKYMIKSGSATKLSLDQRPNVARANLVCKPDV